MWDKILAYFKELFGPPAKPALPLPIFEKPTPVVLVPSPEVTPPMKYIISAIPLYGEKSQNVWTMIEALKARGEDPGFNDSEYGPKVKAALSSFQKKYQLEGTGYVGPRTIALLGIEVTNGPVVTPIPVSSNISFKPDTGKTISTGSDADEATDDWYYRMYLNCGIDKGRESSVKSMGETIVKNRSRYESIQKRTGVPWFVIALLHHKESSGNFNTVLHNGESLSDVNKYGTRLVPKGRGQGQNWTFEDAAVDAITSNPSRWAVLKSGSLDVAKILGACENYNGRGYISGAGKADVSAYLWDSSTVHDGTGKYVSDGKYDGSYPTNKTVGLALGLKWLEVNGYVKLTHGKYDKQSDNGTIETPVVSFTKPSWKKTAEEHIGDKESDPVDNKWYSSFWKYLGLPGYKTISGRTYAWCGVFIAAMLISNGLTYQKNGAGAANWGEFGIEIEYKKVGIPEGAIIWKKTGDQNHVTIANGDCTPEEVNKKEGTYGGLGGNQSDSANVSIYKMSEIQGVRWPKDAPPPKLPIIKSNNCSGGGITGGKTTAIDLHKYPVAA